MKKQMIVTLVLLAAGAANASSFGDDEYNEQNRSQFTGTLSRTEVQSQYAQAAADGSMALNGEDGGSFAINQQAGSSHDIGAVRDEAMIAARTRIIQELMV